MYAHRDVRNLRLEIAATPPSKAHTLMDVLDIDFIAGGDTKRFVSELYASEEGCTTSQRAFSTSRSSSAASAHHATLRPLRSNLHLVGGGCSGVGSRPADALGVLTPISVICSQARRNNAVG